MLGLGYPPYAAAACATQPSSATCMAKAASLPLAIFATMVLCLGKSGRGGWVVENWLFLRSIYSSRTKMGACVQYIGRQRSQAQEHGEHNLITTRAS